ncbi:uncharacterized protein CC84DRAFT_1173391 [Paraphaeosphaeria sporulosa]|uniref:Uncharacterized protein n=1 Tax=Paraphaeosphaeria sporulosa TaxID=1460663 RepID=A0A177CWJ6_9PLEO|nr:uncharacterized protein CC84DRAFT_1173391 [Paraphaeosphaeria sporulosa]OAG11109.1 hypothetical protein CC84DRAFT_1173391 [Paraphaeosphaeria sporulosa]
MSGNAATIHEELSRIATGQGVAPAANEMNIVQERLPQETQMNEIKAQRAEQDPELDQRMQDTNHSQHRTSGTQGAEETAMKTLSDTHSQPIITAPSEQATANNVDLLSAMRTMVSEGGSTPQRAPFARGDMPDVEEPHIIPAGPQQAQNPPSDPTLSQQFDSALDELTSGLNDMYISVFDAVVSGVIHLGLGFKNMCNSSSNAIMSLQMSSTIPFTPGHMPDVEEPRIPAGHQQAQNLPSGRTLSRRFVSALDELTSGLNDMCNSISDAIVSGVIHAGVGVKNMCIAASNATVSGVTHVFKPQRFILALHQLMNVLYDICNSAYRGLGRNGPANVVLQLNGPAPAPTQNPTPPSPANHAPIPGSGSAAIPAPRVQPPRELSGRVHDYWDFLEAWNEGINEKYGW